jgi:hypothetical protein
MKQTTGQFLTQTGVQVAIDANRYSNNDNQPTATTFSGVEVSNGTVVNPDLSNGNGGVTELNHTTEKYVGPNLGIYAAPLQPVPLPPAIALLGSGLLGLFGFGRRKSA